MKDGAHEQADALVVGGGLAGLASATYLARAGRSVTVLERSSQLGGRAITSRAGGFSFNLGPHALYRKGAGCKVLRELDISWTGKVPPTSGFVIRDGTLHRVAYTPWWFLSNRLLQPGAKVGAVRALAKIARMDTRGLEHETLASWLERTVPHPQVRQLFHALVRVATYANAPDRLSAQTALRQLQLAQRGVFYLDGGWQTLVDGLRQAAESAGARIEMNAPVVRVDAGASGSRVHFADGSTRGATSVIVATPVDVAAALLPDTPVARRAADAVPVRAACLDVGLRRLTRPKVTFALGLDAPTYYSVHSKTAELAPEGAAMIHVAKYLSPDDGRDAKETERELEAVLDLTQPGWRDELVERRYLSNMTVVGALATAEQGGNPGRPAPDAAGLPGVFLAGDWVGGEGWLVDAVLASAKRAAELASEHLARTPTLVGAAASRS